MSTYLRLLALMVTALPLAIGNTGASCAPNPGIGNTVDVVFQNETPFEVDVVVNGQRFGTLPANGSSTPTTFDCTAGSVLDLSGDLRTNNGTFPSPNGLTFTNGDNFVCGDTIHVAYFLDPNGDLDLNGFSAR